MNAIRLSRRREATKKQGEMKRTEAWKRSFQSAEACEVRMHHESRYKVPLDWES